MGAICSDRLFLIWSTSAQISIGGRQILNGGTRVPYNLSTGLHPKDIELKQIFQESAMYISRALWIHSVPTKCIKSNVEDSLEVKTLTSFQYCDAAHGMKQHDSFSQRPYVIAIALKFGFAVLQKDTRDITILEQKFYFKKSDSRLKL